MDSKEVETHALSDDQLDRVSGGDLNIGVGVCKNEPKKLPDAIKGFQQMLQEI